MAQTGIHLPSAFLKAHELEALGSFTHDSNTARRSGSLDETITSWLRTGYNPRFYVNDCETGTDWTESDGGTFDVSEDATGNRVGTNGIKLTNTAATDGTQNIETRFLDGSRDLGPSRTLDWRGFDFIGGWLYGGGANHYGTAGELKINIYNDGAWQTGVNMPLSVNAIHQRWDVDITSFDRNRVSKIRFESNNSTTTENVTIDDILVYKFSTGRGPLLGPAGLYEVKSAAAILRGDLVEFEPATMRLDKIAADGVTPFGIALETVTGDANTVNFCWAQYYGFHFLRCNAATIAGEGLIFQSNDSTHGLLVEGGATGVDENMFAKAHEAAGGQYDDIIAFIVSTPTFIS